MRRCFFLWRVRAAGAPLRLQARASPPTPSTSPRRCSETSTCWAAAGHNPTVTGRPKPSQPEPGKRASGATEPPAPHLAWNNAATAGAAQTAGSLPCGLLALQDPTTDGQVRCARDTLLSHDKYGPIGFNFYTDNLPPDTKRVFAVYAHHTHGGPAEYPLCQRLVEELGKFITSKRPGVTFATVGGEQWEDYARLVMAPTVFKEAGSSWGLWATLAAPDRAFSPPWFAPVPNKQRALAFDASSYPEVDGRFKVVSANVLYPALGKQLGLEVQQGATGFPDHAKQMDKIIDWLHKN